MCIFSTKFIVRGSSKWCTSSGEKTTEVDEPWLNEDHISRTIPCAFHLENVIANGLLETTNKMWNQEVVKHVFDDKMATEILRTPLLTQLLDDRLVWKVEKNGHYYVKSTYRTCGCISFTATYALVWNLAVESPNVSQTPFLLQVS